jgi:alkanesulfonate monooxygenase SsuD/methylene tetrahydromethanopterin reductase-like flavin-dependent oxidoreductase (luciferase family)
MALAAYLNPGGDLAATIDCVKLSESLGYDSVWVTHGLGRDSFLVLAAYASATSRIGLGNGVVPIYPRHPVSMAQASLTLSELSGGRFRLGIGVSHQAMISGMLGLGLVEPLAVMREYVAVLRGALAGAAAFEGKHYRAHWTLALPRRPPAPPIYLATLGPKMCELAGEIADGAILWLCPPDYVRDVAVPAMERGRRRAGKTLEGFVVASAVPLAVTNDRSAALAAFRNELTRYIALPFYRTMMEAGGLRDALASYDRDSVVPESMANTLGGIGDAAIARAYLESYRRAGVTLPAVRPITFPDAPWYRRTLEEAARW